MDSVRGESSTHLIQTHVNVDSRHLFLSPSIDVHRKAKWLIPTMCCNNPFHSEGKIKPLVDSLLVFPMLQYINIWTLFMAPSVSTFIAFGYKVKRSIELQYIN